MVATESLLPGGTKAHVKQLLAMLVGLAGAVWLIGPDSLRSGWQGNNVRGFLILQLSCFVWSLGSILQKRRHQSTHPVLVGGIQQLSAGLLALVFCAITGTWDGVWSAKVLCAVLYLSVFGSIVAYSAYLHALQNLPVAVVSLYTYINPVVAVALGSMVYGESRGMREVFAMVVIFSGVWLTNRLSVKP
jgi:drug/metabolite transporter (DMT)-like permease